MFSFGLLKFRVPISSPLGKRILEFARRPHCSTNEIAFPELKFVLSSASFNSGFSPRHDAFIAGSEIEAEFALLFLVTEPEPLSVPMLLVCPACKQRHIDEGEFATKSHHTHACQHCGTVWRPALIPTVGVQFLPGFKNQ